MIPIYIQKIQITSNDLFFGFQGPAGNVFLLELVLKGETVNKLARMHTIYGIKNLASQLILQKAYEIKDECIRHFCNNLGRKFNKVSG